MTSRDFYSPSPESEDGFIIIESRSHPRREGNVTIKRGASKEGASKMSNVPLPSVYNRSTSPKSNNYDSSLYNTTINRQNCHNSSSSPPPSSFSSSSSPNHLGHQYQRIIRKKNLFWIVSILVMAIIIFPILQNRPGQVGLEKRGQFPVAILSPTGIVEYLSHQAHRFALVLQRCNLPVLRLVNIKSLTAYGPFPICESPQSKSVKNRNLEFVSSSQGLSQIAPDNGYSHSGTLTTNDSRFDTDESSNWLFNHQREEVDQTSNNSTLSNDRIVEVVERMAELVDRRKGREETSLVPMEFYTSRSREIREPNKKFNAYGLIEMDPNQSEIMVFG